LRFEPAHRCSWVALLGVLDRRDLGVVARVNGCCYSREWPKKGGTGGCYT
jgi:hypothetical protein